MLPMEPNLAPFDGELYWLQQFYAKEKADAYFQKLFGQLDWQQEELFIYGRRLKVPRLMAWYGDDDAHYRYSGVDHLPQTWTEDLLAIKNDVDERCGQSFNSVLANLYRNGQDSMGCHADNEKELGLNPIIASLSFGDSRFLRFRHNKTRQKLEVELAHGDLLLMAGDLQHNWRHELPKSKKTKLPRINLTFRRIVLPH